MQKFFFVLPVQCAPVMTSGPRPDLRIAAACIAARRSSLLRFRGVKIDGEFVEPYLDFQASSARRGEHPAVKLADLLIGDVVVMALCHPSLVVGPTKLGADGVVDARYAARVRSISLG